MLWPGAVYDGEAARIKYTEQIAAAGKRLGIDIALRPEPLYSREEAGNWVAEAAAAKPDGLLMMLLDRQEHAWPAVSVAADSGIPTVAFAPVGTAFITNTAPLAKRIGVFIASTDDFRQAEFGPKMLRAATKLREMRFIVLKGKESKDTVLDPPGTKLRYIPAKAFLEEHDGLPVTAEVKRMAAECIKGCTRMVGAAGQDVINGLKS
jgi:hypothetical protein